MRQKKLGLKIVSDLIFGWAIPAAIAVWALVKSKVFAAYILLGILGATLSGIIWQLAA